MSASDFDAIVATGNVMVNVRIGVVGVDAPCEIVIGPRATAWIEQRVLRLGADDAGAAEASTRPAVSIDVGSLTGLAAWRGATVVLTGAVDQLDIEALHYGKIDASELQLRAATVSLELSSVSVNAAESVSGFVAYQSDLTVSGGSDVSDITTTNAGRLHIASSI